MCSGRRYGLGLVVLFAATALYGCGGSGSRAGVPSPDEIAITCPAPMLQPNATPAATAPSQSCAPTSGSLIIQLDCATLTDISKLHDVRLSELNNQTGSTTDAAVVTGLQDGQCTVQLPEHHAGFIRTNATLSDGVAMVDFIPVRGAVSVGLAFRCPDTTTGSPCLAAFIYSNQDYECIEVNLGKANPLARGTFAGQQFPAPSLQMNKPNRLVLSVKGSTMVAFLNGRQLCNAQVHVPPSSPASVDVLITHTSEGTDPATVNISHFYVLGAP